MMPFYSPPSHRGLIFFLFLYTGLIGNKLSGVAAKDHHHKEDHHVITTIEAEPFLMFHNASGQTGNSQFTGFIPDLIHEVSVGMSFSYEFRLVADGLYGEVVFPEKEDEPHHWSGLIGELTEGVARIAAAPLTVTERRKTAVDFSIPWLNVSHTALLRKEFSTVNNLQELLLMEHYLKYGTIAGSFTAKRLKGKPYLLYAHMWARMASSSPSVLVENNQKGLERVRTEDYALILETPEAEYLAMTPPCDVKTIQPFMNGYKYAFAVQQNDTLRHELNRALKQILDSGKVQQIYNKWWPKGYCDQTDQKPDPLLSYFNCANGTFDCTLTLVFATAVKIYLLRCMQFP